MITDTETNPLNKCALIGQSLPHKPMRLSGVALEKIRQICGAGARRAPAKHNGICGQT
jgi:hypothetical protein